MTSPLASGGNRLRWEQLPARLRQAVEAGAGARVRSATSQSGGFSPGVASVLRLADERSVFLKAVNAARNPDSPGMHRQEVRVLTALPEGTPVPQLLWHHDDGDWVALMTEAIDGRQPVQPWHPGELARFLEAADNLATVLTPGPPGLPTVQERFADAFTGWRHLAGEPAAADGLDPWTRRRLDALAGIEQDWATAAAGTTLLHADLRADNVLLCRRETMVVDWPHACVGAGWVDLLLALPSVAMHGGGAPEQLWHSYRPARPADPDAVTAVLAAAVGYFLWQARQPPPPNLPTLRAFQHAQGLAGLGWLRRRIDGR